MPVERLVVLRVGWPEVLPVDCEALPSDLFTWDLLSCVLLPVVLPEVLELRVRV